MAINLEPFNLQELTQDILQKFMLKAEQRQIRLNTTFDTPLPFAIADIALIERVFENLLENAFHYTPEKGRVDIQIKYQDDIIIKITDSGPGIPDIKSPIFLNGFISLKKGERDQKLIGIRAGNLPKNY